jgi:hypothetical protein
MSEGDGRRRDWEWEWERYCLVGLRWDRGGGWRKKKNRNRNRSVVAKLEDLKMRRFWWKEKKTTRFALVSELIEKALSDPSHLTPIRPFFPTLTLCDIRLLTFLPRRGFRLLNRSCFYGFGSFIPWTGEVEKVGLEG